SGFLIRRSRVRVTPGVPSFRPYFAARFTKNSRYFKEISMLFKKRPAENFPRVSPNDMGVNLLSHPEIYIQIAYKVFGVPDYFPTNCFATSMAPINNAPTTPPVFAAAIVLAAR
ncbi:MAG: hypothetical protein ACOYOU_17680, partial [Kiritimatiellia bacterium]